MRKAVSRLAGILWLQKTVGEVSEPELMFQKRHRAKIPERRNALLDRQQWRDWPATSMALSSRWQWLPCLSTRHSLSETGRKQPYRHVLDIPLRLQRGRSARRCSRRQASALHRPTLPPRKPRTRARFPLRIWDPWLDTDVPSRRTRRGA